MNYAPISISTYSRYEHLKKVIESLKMNSLAEETVLYVFSDAPRKGDEAIVQKIRDYLDTVDGFKDVRVIKQPVNDFKKNIKDAYTIPLTEFGTMIRLEDDIVTSSYFLEYMNEALRVYKDDKSVFAISGYTPSVNLGICKDVFLSKDFSAWGYATWLDKEFIVARERSDYYSKLKEQVCKVTRIKKVHPLMWGILRLMEKGRGGEPGDYKLSANLYLNDLFVVRPQKALVKNIGFDGSGAGNRKTKIFDTEIDPKYKPLIEADLVYNEKPDNIILGYYFNYSILHKGLISLRFYALSIIPDSVYRSLKKLVRKNKLILRMIKM
jgi:hypothetical protein